MVLGNNGVLNIQHMGLSEVGSINHWGGIILTSGTDFLKCLGCIGNGICFDQTQIIGGLHTTSFPIVDDSVTYDFDSLHFDHIIGEVALSNTCLVLEVVPWFTVDTCYLTISDPHFHAKFGDIILRSVTV
jgi:hypothetical protein